MSALREAELRATRYWLKLARQKAVRNVRGPVLKSRSGKLAKAIREFVKIGRGNRIEGGLEVTGPASVWGRIWEKTGHRGFFVRPKKRGGVLVWRDGGTTRFSRGHFIPRQRARPFMRPALEETMPQGERRLIKEVQPILAFREFTKRVRVRIGS